jgi:uncharacterized protein DUF5993
MIFLFVFLFIAMAFAMWSRYQNISIMIFILTIFLSCLEFAHHATDKLNIQL